MAREDFSGPVNFGNQEYIQQLLDQYRRDPSSISNDWGAFFQGVDFATVKGQEMPLSSSTSVGEIPLSHLRVKVLIGAYRRFGHLMARTNPTLSAPEEPSELSLPFLGFEMGELSQSFPTLGLLPKERAPLEELIRRLREIYCGPISYEFEHVDNQEIREWMHKKIVSLPADLEPDLHRWLLLKLFKAKEFEAFLQKKFLGAKRFSLEGAETFLPLLAELIDCAAKNHYKTGIIGMAHRGRLSTLCNLLQKPYALLFHEFSSEALPKAGEGLGDVKYHKGYSQELTTRSSHKIKVILAANPSHLESVDPVVLGMSLGKQKMLGGVDTVLPILIHGDAAVAGQGVVYEVMQFMNIDGYSVGGSVHVVINNQIGFTAEPQETRSTRYCTDIAKAFSAPVIHVNAEDPIACLKAALIAFEVRHRFHVDVFIDLNCHRLYGHNEADEPRFTNPKLYQTIKEKDHIYKAFSMQLVKSGVVSQQEVDEMENKFRAELQAAFDEAGRFAPEEKVSDQDVYLRMQEMARIHTFEEIETKIDVATFKRLATQITAIPDGFTAHPKIRKLFETRREELLGDKNLSVVDWASGELLAFASLVENGIHVRFSGEDSKRGTFSHRHATLVDQESGASYTPLAHTSPKQAPFEIYSSPLAEFGVMGFDYGYSIVLPKALVIWEGQFGDFANGAQIIIDQYFVSSETKWGKASGLTLFLPHGLEGMGPEHSSARLERFLQLAALDNMRIVVPSTTAQLFHLIKRQGMSERKKPLVVMTPKSMLRLASSFSTPNEIVEGKFQTVIPEAKPLKNVRRVVLCAGKIYHELAQRRDEIKSEEVAIIRLEQLYPLHSRKLLEAVEPYKGVKEICFVQEEPSNQGAWEYLQPLLTELLQREIRYIGRPRSSVPDTGYARLFHIQQEGIIAEAIGKKKEEHGKD